MQQRVREALPEGLMYTTVSGEMAPGHRRRHQQQEESDHQAHGQRHYALAKIIYNRMEIPLA